jgi:hypothetical protein
VSAWLAVLHLQPTAEIVLSAEDDKDVHASLCIDVGRWMIGSTANLLQAKSKWQY